MALARKKSTRANIRRLVQSAIQHEKDPTILLALYNKAKSQTRYDNLIKQLHRKYLKLSLPPLFPQDKSDINLRECWIESTVRLKKNMSNRMHKALLKKGYLQSMVDQLKPKSVGGEKFEDLIKVNAINLSAEFIIFNFHSELITHPVRKAIATLLHAKGAKMAKHAFLMHALNGEYTKL
jgi:hypothetical protein